MFNPNREMMHHYLADALALIKSARRHNHIGWSQSSKGLFREARLTLKLANIHRDKWLNTPAIMFAEPPKQEAKIIDLV